MRTPGAVNKPIVVCFEGFCFCFCFFDLQHSLFFVFVLTVLGMEPRVLCMLGKCWTTELHPQRSFLYFILKT